MMDNVNNNNNNNVSCNTALLQTFRILIQNAALQSWHEIYVYCYTFWYTYMVVPMYVGLLQYYGFLPGFCVIKRDLSSYHSFQYSSPGFRSCPGHQLLWQVFYNFPQTLENAGIMASGKLLWHPLQLILHHHM
jgi:hypothetical protein